MRSEYLGSRNKPQRAVTLSYLRPAGLWFTGRTRNLCRSMGTKVPGSQWSSMGCSFLAVAFPWTEEPFSPQELIIAVPRVEKRRMLHEREMSHFPPVGPLRNHLHAAAAAPIWLLHARILLYEAALFTSQLESDILLALLALCGVNLLSPWPTSYDTYTYPTDLPTFSYRLFGIASSPFSFSNRDGADSWLATMPWEWDIVEVAFFLLI